MKFKQCAFDLVEKQRTDEDTAKAIITTSSPDRRGDIIEPSGVDFSTWQNTNSVVLYQHGYDPVVGSAPIGKGTNIQTFKKKIEAEWQWADKVDSQALRIKGLWEADFLRSVSVGIIPLETEDIESKKDDLWSQLFPSQKILKSELVEFSIVSIPMNKDAVKKDLDVQLLTLIQKIEEKLVPVEEILKKAQEIDSQIKLLKEIETHIDNDQVDEKLIPWVSYKFTDSPWSALFLSNTETDFSFSYAYQSCAPHHSIEDGNIVTSFSAVCMGLAMINGTKKDIEGAHQAYTHLSKHYQEKKHTAPDYAYKQWTPLQVTSFLRSESVNEDHILMTLTDCGLSTEEALKLVKPVQEKKEVVEEKSSDDFDQMLNEILAGCKDIVSLVI